VKYALELLRGGALVLEAYSPEQQLSVSRQQTGFS